MAADTSTVSHLLNFRVTSQHKCTHTDTHTQTSSVYPTQAAPTLRISHNKHGHSIVTSRHGSVFICCCILSLLFVVLLCVLDSLSVFLPPHPFLLQFLPPFFSLFFGSPTTPWFCLPPPHDEVYASSFFPLCCPSSFMSHSQFLPHGFSFSPTHSFPSSSSLAPSIRRRTSIPTAHSGAIPSAP